MTPTVAAVQPYRQPALPAVAAPAAVAARLLREIEHRTDTERCFRSQRRTMEARAAALTGNRADAEDATCQTFLEMLRGDTEPSRSYRALRANALDIRRRNNREAKRRVPLERTISPAALSLEEGAWGPEGIDTLSLEPFSSRSDDRDPLDILIAREEEEQRKTLVLRALKDPRWRYVKTRKWGAILREHVRI